MWFAEHDTNDANLRAKKKNNKLPRNELRDDWRRTSIDCVILVLNLKINDLADYRALREREREREREWMNEWMNEEEKEKENENERTYKGDDTIWEILRLCEQNNNSECLSFDNSWWYPINLQ
jgi:hypothetical protein